jgi:hypothetical protein
MFSVWMRMRIPQLGREEKPMNDKKDGWKSRIQSPGKEFVLPKLQPHVFELLPRHLSKDKLDRMWMPWLIKFELPLRFQSKGVPDRLWMPWLIKYKLLLRPTNKERYVSLPMFIASN